MRDSDIVASPAVSLDGYIAAADGSVDFLQTYPLEDFDFDAFVADIGALIMGSTTYEQSIQWGWMWGERPTMVLTTRTGLEVPDGANIMFAATPTGEAIRSFAAVTPKRLWVFGGGRVAGWSPMDSGMARSTPWTSRSCPKRSAPGSHSSPMPIPVR